MLCTYIHILDLNIKKNSGLQHLIVFHLSGSTGQTWTEIPILCLHSKYCVDKEVQGNK